MQTNFSAEQLRDPDTAVANQVLRTCVHCGFCTATCPTFLLLGDELDSPRGRIYLIKDMLESGRPATAEVVLHIDRCLSCLSCMTTCPSGVNYMHLVDHARTYIEQTYTRPWHERALRAVLAWVLPRPGVLRLALLGARLALAAGVKLNFQFLWECEEEIGSPSFAMALARMAKGQPGVGTDSIMVSDTIWPSAKQPAIPVGLRGLLAFVVRLQTGDKAVHSGTTGGAARNPVGELCALIAACYQASTGKVLIPGFYDGIRKPTAQIGRAHV